MRKKFTLTVYTKNGTPGPSETKGPGGNGPCALLAYRNGRSAWPEYASGLLHVLLGIGEARQLASHPVLGASWEGFGVEQVLAILGARDEEAYFWRSHTGAPKLTASIRTAFTELKLDGLTVVHAGDRTLTLGPSVKAVPLRDVLTALPTLR